MNKIGDNFRIGRTVKTIAFITEFFIEAFRVDDVTVMRYGYDIVAAADDDRLGIADTTGTSCRIAVMADGDIPGELA